MRQQNALRHSLFLTIVLLSFFVSVAVYSAEDAGYILAWGANSSGQLGDGTGGPDEYSITPVTVVDIDAAVAVSDGFGYTMALLADGTIKAWGGNNCGQLGDGTGGDYSDRSTTPVTVTGIDTAIAISAGGGHSVALLADGTIQAWGGNNAGQLGDGTGGEGEYSTTPVTVVGIDNAIAVAAGGSHSVALLADGTIKAWGYNYRGSLGDGTGGYGEYSTTPVTVVGIDTAVAVSAGFAHTVALCVSDKLATTITSGPSSPLPDSNVEFTFEANKPVECFYYRLWPLESGCSKTTLKRWCYNNR